MSVDCEISGVTVVTSGGRFQGTIAVKDGRIAGLLARPTGQADRHIDASGLVALPGMVDQHVHFMDPGSTEREDFVHGSSAAAAAGVTTVVEHTHATPVLDVRTLAEKVNHLRGRSVVDYGLAAHVFPNTIDNVPALWNAGVAFFKVFTCTTHGVPALLPDDLLRLFQTLERIGSRALVHCEDEFITEDNEKCLHAAMRDDFGVIPEWRSPEAELVAVNTVALLARLTCASVTIAHASQPSIVELAKREKRLGAAVSVESCPQYFYLTGENVREYGPTMKFTPPARDLESRAAMWACLREGDISIVSSDHAPSTIEQKFATNIWECPFGLPGVDTTLTLFLNAVNEGWITLEQLTAAYSTNPARLLGLYPQKGTIQVGADADIVLVDMSAERELCNEEVISKAAWTPFAGKRVKGRPVMTLLRGTVLAENGKVTGEPGTGRFLPGRGHAPLIER